MSNVNFNDSTPAAQADGSINIRWQSDTNGNISASYNAGAWQSWTPTVTPAGSMTVSGITASGAFIHEGSSCKFTINVSCTLGGTASQYVDLGLPPGLPLVGSLNFDPLVLIAQGGGSFVACVGYITPSLSTVCRTFLNGAPSTPNWTLGAANLQVTGFYRCG